MLWIDDSGPVPAQHGIVPTLAYWNQRGMKRYEAAIMALTFGPLYVAARVFDLDFVLLVLIGLPAATVIQGLAERRLRRRGFPSR